MGEGTYAPTLTFKSHIQPEHFTWFVIVLSILSNYRWKSSRVCNGSLQPIMLLSHFVTLLFYFKFLITLCQFSRFVLFSDKFPSRKSYKPWHCDFAKTMHSTCMFFILEVLIIGELEIMRTYPSL